MAPQTTDAPYYDSVLEYGHGYLIPQSHSAPYLDTMATWGHGAYVGTAPSFTDLTVKVGTTELDESFSRSFRDELTGPGSFRLSFANDDPDLPDFDDVVRFNIAGVPRFAGVVEAKDVVTFDPGENVAKVTQVSGRGSLALLDSGLVEPVRGLGATPVEITRTFSWPSLDFDGSAWPNSKRIRRTDVRTLRTPHRYSPEWWPDPTSWWVWADRSDVSEMDAPIGTCLFRHEFTTAADYTVAIFVAQDNSGFVWLDGAKIVDPESDRASYTVGRRVEVDISTGDHVLAAQVYNTGRGGGLNFTIWTVDEDGLLDTMIEHSDYNVKCLGYPPTIPGFTAGRAIRIAVEEAQARDELQGVALGFSDLVDSDGQAWDTTPEIIVEVGRSVMEMVKSLSDWLIDVQMAPGASVLRAWNWGTRGGTPGITIAATTNPTTSEVLELSHSGRHVRVNRLVLRYKQGYTEVEDATSVAANNQRTAFVDLGDVNSAATAQAIGEQLLTLRKDPQFAHSLTLLPVGSQPYEDFENGDTVTHPNEIGTTSASRVRAITLTESDDQGILTYGLELNDTRMELEERHNNWLERQSMGSLAGGAQVTSRSGEPLAPSVRISTTNVAEFSYNNSTLTASYSPKRPADWTGNLIEIYATLTTAGSTTTTVRVYQNGVQLGADLTFAAGVTTAEVDLGATPCYRNVDLFQARIVTVGTGAEGLDVQVRAI